MFKKYDPKKIELKWQKYWEKNRTFAVTEDPNKEKFYALVEFPYPSGAGLHVGHPRPFTAMDVVARKKRMEGKNVLYPMGFDAFGLPTENYAIKTGRAPADVTKENIANFTRQLKSLGFSFDWSRCIDTTDPKYYKWTQWLFLQFFKHGLAYKKNQPINWCPKDKIGLANEEVVNGCCERCGETVERRNKEQWMLGITKYADKLLEGLKEVDYIPQARTQQENWIGKSEGAEIEFSIKNQESSITVFTTRPETLFGAFAVIIAPEHALIKSNESVIENLAEVQEYIEQVKKKSDIERTELQKEKTGVEVRGLKAINPVNGEELPIWTADFVLGNYGTGAVFADMHDDRDFAFAKKYNLPMKQVVMPNLFDEKNPPQKDKVYTKRETVHVILRNTKNKTVLVEFLKGDQWKGNEPRNFIIGGIEEGEKEVETAIREIREETGYVNVSLVERVALDTQANFFAAHKGVNRNIHVSTLVFDLIDEKKVEITEDEYFNKGSHEVKWIPYEKVAETLTIPDDKMAWKYYSTGGFAYTGDGILINSDFLNGLTTQEGKEKIIEFLEKNNSGKRKVQYKLRDWVFSRQRYWGEPIPIVICEKCGQVPLPESELPLTLPKVEKYEPTDTGESPLSTMTDWVNTDCPRCAKMANETKYLIFDFDGVIGNTLEATLKAMVGIGYAKDHKDARRQIFEYFDKKPWHTKDSVITPEHKAERDSFSEKLGNHIKQEGFELFTEFIAEIMKIDRAHIAIVSSGSKIYIEEKIGASGLAVSHVLTFEDHHSKQEKIERVCKDWGVELSDIIYFTDTKADVYELENCLDRRSIIGCAWGFHGYEKLAEVLPQNQILKNFSDIHNLFKPGQARRETDTMPNWAGSSWYWLRYMDPHNDSAFAAKEKLQYWNQVDWYNGGMEHTVLHLLYSRFWNQFFFDIGLVPTLEPYKKRTSHGMILAKGGEKMSKSRGNVVNPDDMVEQFGADALRAYIMFMGPFDQAVEWDTNGLVGVRRFLDRVWNLQEKIVDKKSNENITTLLHQTIKKVSEDIEAMRFNTAISALMELTNEMTKEENIDKDDYAVLIKLLSPFAPHISEELWANLGNDQTIAISDWPKYDPNLIQNKTLQLVVQVNGKMRDSIELNADISEDEAKTQALKSEKVQKWLEGKEPKKVIYVKGKLVSIVI